MPKKEVARLRTKPNISAFITEAVREKLDAEDKARQEEALAQAYKASAQEDKELLEDWDSLAGDSL